MGSSTVLSELNSLNELLKCKEDGTYFTSNYLKVFEPRPAYGVGWKPFILWPRQIEYFHFIESQYQRGRGGVVEKCRDMGATLTTLAWMFWKWRFTANFTGLIGSLKEEEVKKIAGDPDPLFSKLDGFLSNLPAWLNPTGFNYDIHSMSMSLHNPETKSVITGSSCTDKFGLSKRKSFVLADEYADWKFSVTGNCRHTTKSFFRVSTIKGNNHFSQESDQAAETGDQFIFNWDESPLHTEDWFKKEREADTTPNKINFARFVLRDRKASVQGLVYEDFANCIKNLPIPYNPALPLYTTTDFGLADETVTIFIQRDPETKELFVIDEVVANNQVISFFVPFYPGAKPVSPNPHIYTAQEQTQIDLHKGWERPRRNFGDYSGTQRNAITKTSIWEELAAYNVKMQLDRKFYYDMAERVRITRKLLPRLSVDPKCKRFIKSMENYHYPDVKLSGVTPTNPKGVHDANSHACTALEFFAISEGRCDADTEQEKRLNQGQATITRRDPFRTREELRTA